MRNTNRALNRILLTILGIILLGSRRRTHRGRHPPRGRRFLGNKPLLCSGARAQPGGHRPLAGPGSELVAGAGNCRAAGRCGPWRSVAGVAGWRKDTPPGRTLRGQRRPDGRGRGAGFRSHQGSPQRKPRRAGDLRFSLGITPRNGSAAAARSPQRRIPPGYRRHGGTTAPGN